QLQLLTEAAAERLKDGDLSFARGIILAVLRQRPSSEPPDPAAMSVFQEIRATDPALVIMAGHKAAVRSISYSPDGTQVLTGPLDHTVRLWDAGTGIELMRLPVRPGAVMTVAYSADGARALTAAHDAGRTWDARTGRELLVRRDPRGVKSAAYSP